MTWRRNSNSARNIGRRQPPSGTPPNPPIGWRSALAKAAAGDPLGAIEHRLKLLGAAEQEMVRVLLFAGRLHTLGGEGPRGPHFTAVEQGGLCAASQANVLSEHWTNIGLLWLEAGQPAEAAAAFRRACIEVQRPSPFRGLAGRYYFLITKEFLDQP